MWIRDISVGDTVLLACTSSTAAWSRQASPSAKNSPTETHIREGAEGRPRYGMTGSSLTMPTPCSRSVASTASAISTIARLAAASRLRPDERLADVRRLAQGCLQRHRAEQRGRLTRPAGLAARPEHVRAHVLDHAQQAHVRLLLRHERGTSGHVLRQRHRAS